MPVISNVETAQTILYALSDNLPNSFVPGQCTWGIASRLPITWSGNANEWAVNAQAQGIEVTNTPTVGSIAQTSGDSYLGHVALVESLNPDGSFVVWEMNGANGPFTTDERTTTTAEFPNFILF
jgi:surface antigen